MITFWDWVESNQKFYTNWWEIQHRESYLTLARLPHCATFASGGERGRRGTCSAQRLSKLSVVEIWADCSRRILAFVVVYFIQVCPRSCWYVLCDGSVLLRICPSSAAVLPCPDPNLYLPNLTLVLTLHWTSHGWLLQSSDPDSVQPRLCYHPAPVIQGQYLSQLREGKGQIFSISALWFCISK